ncbi:hypothetical protein ICN30_08280 [Polynucleobacter sp. 31A-FELB]|uniref:hypothetical protein n=1 Tax=Polynucleobacter sp. 31A-FELB TaxID=2689096 RepID=UPI001C0DB1A0|nr:hypothetical protein [Polynucleobacter sp. 31A-FELB]MBU3587829.1 hypothetical protein [Polynucleobacter sp. 31A-FELB]
MARYFNNQVLPFLAFDDLTQFVYLPSGIRLLAVAIFGWLGALGITLGWIFCHVVGGEKTFLECLFIGLISGATAMASWQIWQSFLKIEVDLDNLTLKYLLYLVSISSLVGAVVRYLYIASVDPLAQFWPILTIGLVGDVTGALIVLYLIKAIAWIWNSFSEKLR